MGEPEDIPSAARIAGTIPLFFYDLIGRIVPGAVLILGLLLYTRRDLLGDWFDGLQKVFPKDSSAGYEVAMLLLFFAFAYFCGVVLSSLSYMVVEWIWNRFRPLNLKTFAEHYGVSNGGLEKRLEAYFGVTLRDGSLDRASALCAFYVWRKDIKLGIITARTDAELLGARSLVLVSLILLLVPFLHSWTDGPMQRFAWGGCLALILVSTLLTYDYLRQKRVFMRCALFLASTEPLEDHKKHNDERLAHSG
jgi:hypothetical protein